MERLGDHLPPLARIIARRRNAFRGPAYSALHVTTYLSMTKTIHSDPKRREIERFHPAPRSKEGKKMLLTVAALRGSQ